MDFLLKLVARPYIAGESIDDALRCAARLLEERGIASTLDLLGEESKDPGQLQSAMALYRSLIGKASAIKASEEDPLRPTVSLKPSTFTVTHRNADGSLAKTTDLARAEANITEIADFAKEKGIDLTIDMEDHAWVDFTLDCHRKLFAGGYRNVGTVLQSRLFRTKEDIQSIPEGARIRLVIGIYREPSSIALTVARKMKKMLVAYAEALIERGVKLEYATHDEEYIFRFFREVVLPHRLPRESYEVQMLLGVPRRRIQDELVAGTYTERKEFGDAMTPARATVRLYVPFARSWGEATAYCKRRLSENPNIVLYGIRNFFSFS